MKIAEIKRFISRKIILNFLEKGIKFVRSDKNDAVVLCYHSMDKRGNSYTVSPELFEKHIKKIAKKADFVSLSQILKIKKNRKSRKKSVVAVTFDDGYQDIFSILPVLKKYKVSATVFALSMPKQVSRLELDHSGKLLSYKQLIQLHSAGIEIGCHSATHADFHALRTEDRIKEVITAKKVMEKNLGFQVKYFAYPKGRYNQHIVNAVKEAGYHAAFTTNHALLHEKSDRLLLPRVVVDGTYGEDDFPAIHSISTFYLQSLHRALFHNRIIFAMKDLLRSDKVSLTQVSDKKLTGKKLLVSIATSAYNEKNNISHFLQSALSQTGENILVKEIIVATDGCTDSTVKVVKSFHNAKIKIIEGKIRLGKSERLNQIFKSFVGDVLVVFDADGYLESKYTVSTLIRPFESEKKLGLVAGKMIPLAPRKLIEKAAVNFYEAHYKAVQFFDYNTSAYGCHGLLAYNKRFAKSLVIPQECLVDDAFSYFSNLSQGFTYRFVERAIVRYRCPQTVSDYLRQSLRYYAGGEQLSEYFPQDMVWGGYRLPRNVLIKTFLHQIKSDVVSYLVLKILHAYILYKTRVQNAKLNVRWSIIQSSKLL